MRSSVRGSPVAVRKSLSTDRRASGRLRGFPDVASGRCRVIWISVVPRVSRSAAVGKARCAAGRGIVAASGRVIERCDPLHCRSGLPCPRTAEAATRAADVRAPEGTDPTVATCRLRKSVCGSVACVRTSLCVPHPCTPANRDGPTPPRRREARRLPGLKDCLSNSVMVEY